MAHTGYAERLAELGLQAQVMWVLAIASAACLLVAAVKLGNHYRPAETSRSPPGSRHGLLGRLHRGDSASASIEFLLVLFPLLVIVLTVWQFAFMINARLHVGYAAYAAARSAAVIIPKEIGTEGSSDYEPEGVLNNDAAKWKRIRRAAVPGVLAISPGQLTNAGLAYKSWECKLRGLGACVTELPAMDLEALTPRLTLMTVHKPDFYTETRETLFGTASVNRLTRAGVKSLYADNATEVLINGRDHEGRQQQGNKTIEPFDLTAQEVVSVTVNYGFWLSVPFVGRMMEAAFEGWRNPLTGESISLSLQPTRTISETVPTNLWTRKRAIDPCT
jgi:hypothetical protein